MMSSQQEWYGPAHLGYPLLDTLPMQLTVAGVEQIARVIVT